MADWKEKGLPDAPITPVDSDEVTDIETQNPQLQPNPAPLPASKVGVVPKRKPVPGALATAAPAAPAPATSVPTIDAPHNGYTGRHVFGSRMRPFWSRWTTLPAGRKRRRFILIGAIVAAVLVLALIIGLAVGLTVGRRHSTSNLPLPSAHGGPYSGDLTYYDPGLGACGITSTSADMICAVSHTLFDEASTGSNPNANPLCGLKIRIRRDGKSVDVTIVDRCVGCKETDLDVSQAVFQKLAPLADGRVKMEWSWLENAPVAVT